MTSWVPQPQSQDHRRKLLSSFDIFNLLHFGESHLSSQIEYYIS